MFVILPATPEQHGDRNFIRTVISFRPVTFKSPFYNAFVGCVPANSNAFVGCVPANSRSHCTIEFPQSSFATLQHYHNYDKIFSIKIIGD